MLLFVKKTLVSCYKSDKVLTRICQDFVLFLSLFHKERHLIGCIIKALDLDVRDEYVNIQVVVEPVFPDGRKKEVSGC